MEEEYAVQERPLFSGVCVGGPMDGQDASSRFPYGFLLCDRPAHLVWIYDYTPGEGEGQGQFLVRVSEGVRLVEDPDEPKNRWRAAVESEFDVLAAPWVITPEVETPQAVEEGAE